jgi:hypothetical protein
MHVAPGSPGDLLRGHTGEMFIVAVTESVSEAEMVAVTIFIGLRLRDAKGGMFSALHGDSLEVHPDDIDAFAKVKDEDLPTRAHLKVLRSIPEDDIKRAVAGLVGEPSVPKDWGGERSDLFTSRVTIGGKRVSTAFLFKGPGGGFEPMTSRHLGRNGDQVDRLFTEPADLLVIQHCHEVRASVRGMMRAYANQLGNPRRYCIIDGYDTVKILRAYGLCGQVQVQKRERRYPAEPEFEEPPDIEYVGHAHGVLDFDRHERSLPLEHRVSEVDEHVPTLRVTEQGLEDAVHPRADSGRFGGQASPDPTAGRPWRLDASQGRYRQGVRAMSFGLLRELPHPMPPWIEGPQDLLGHPARSPRPRIHPRPDVLRPRQDRPALDPPDLVPPLSLAAVQVDRPRRDLQLIPQEGGADVVDDVAAHDEHAAQPLVGGQVEPDIQAVEDDARVDPLDEGDVAGAPLHVDVGVHDGAVLDEGPRDLLPAHVHPYFIRRYLMRCGWSASLPRRLWRSASYSW